MRHVVTVGALAALLLAGAAPCHAQYGGGGFGGGLGRGAESAKTIKVMLDQARQDYERARARVEAGVDTDVLLGEYQTRIVQLESQLEQAVTQEERQRLLGEMRRPIDVQLRDASIRQAAEVMERASGVKFVVGDAVSPTTRLTVDARSVPLALVLDSIGRQANLMIEPAGNSVRLANWPILEINGEKQMFTGPKAPWSDDWGFVPLVRNLTAVSLPAGHPGTPGFATTPAPGAGGPGGFAPPATVPAPDPVEVIPGPSMAMPPFGGVASLGNAVVVAEPGTNQRGEPGVWLTVYGLQGNSLRKKSTLFHRSTARAVPGAEPHGFGMGMPGGMSGGYSRGIMPGGAFGGEGFGGGGLGGELPVPGAAGGGGATAPAPTRQKPVQKAAPRPTKRVAPGR